MAVKAISQTYWRSIRRGNRLFAEVPEGVKEDIRTLAQADVASRVITPEEYKNYIGEDYPAE